MMFSPRQEAACPQDALYLNVLSHHCYGLSIATTFQLVKLLDTGRTAVVRFSVQKLFFAEGKQSHSYPVVNRVVFRWGQTAWRVKITTNLHTVQG